jgi:hypothetical protein
MDDDVPALPMNDERLPLPLTPSSAALEAVMQRRWARKVKGAVTHIAVAAELRLDDRDRKVTQCRAVAPLWCVHGADPGARRALIYRGRWASSTMLFVIGSVPRGRRAV